MLEGELFQLLNQMAIAGGGSGSGFGCPAFEGTNLIMGDGGKGNGFFDRSHDVFGGKVPSLVTGCLTKGAVHGIDDHLFNLGTAEVLCLPCQQVQVAGVAGERERYPGVRRRLAG